MLNDRATAVVSASAITSPAWLPTLDAVSATAGTFAPILGCVWIVFQIALKLFELGRFVK